MVGGSKTDQTLFQQGVILARSGQKGVARGVFQHVVTLDPAHEAAWLYLAGLAESETASNEALNRVAELNPANPYLQKARAWVKQTWPVSTDQDQAINLLYPVPRTPGASDERASPRGHLRQKTASWNIRRSITLIAASLILLIGLVVGLVIVQGPVTSFAAAMMATPTNTIEQELARLQQRVDQAVVESDRPAMIAALEQMRALAPDDQEIARQLAWLYYRQGLVLRNDNNFVEAKAAFAQALAVRSDFEAAQEEARWADLYLTGAVPHQNADWAEAIAIFEQLYDENPDYPNVDEILYSAYFNQGVGQKAQGELKDALVSFRKAADILPEIPDAEAKVTEVARLLNPPPAPTPTPQPAVEKRIVVDITDQRTYAYEGDDLAFDFIVSTGEPGRDTAIGEFEILDKIPMAYASTWNLDMPFWLGIYWVGPLENGFHAVPTQRDTGVTMWEGYLGQRVSYGCIVLSMKDAELLYNWVDIGTPVSIQW